MISIMSSKVEIIIIGGGKAALIKARSFIQKKCRVYILSIDFCRELVELKKLNQNRLIFIKRQYEKKYIMDKHLIIIATNSEEVNEKIRNDCKSEYKIYIDCSDAKKGICIVPCQRNTKQTNFGINMASPNPKAAIYMASKTKDYLRQYDDFLEYASALRKKLKNMDMKKAVMEFVCSDDFCFFYKKKKHNEVLKMFYNDFI